jgi:hypothetical protein
MAQIAGFGYEGWAIAPSQLPERRSTPQFFNSLPIPFKEM